MITDPVLGPRCWPPWHRGVHLSFLLGKVTTPILQLRKLRPREMKGLSVQGLIAHMWQSSFQGDGI